MVAKTGGLLTLALVTNCGQDQIFMHELLVIGSFLWYQCSTEQEPPKNDE